MVWKEGDRVKFPPLFSFLSFSFSSPSSSACFFSPPSQEDWTLTFNTTFYQNVTGEEKEEETSDVSEELSEDSEVEDKEDNDQRPVQLEDSRQETGDSMVSSSSEDMETISVAVKSPTHSQFLASQGIFSASQSSQGQRTAGPLITEIITGGGNY